MRVWTGNKICEINSNSQMCDTPNKYLLINTIQSIQKKITRKTCGFEYNKQTCTEQISRNFFFASVLWTKIFLKKVATKCNVQYLFNEILCWRARNNKHIKLWARIYIGTQMLRFSQFLVPCAGRSCSRFRLSHTHKHTIQQYHLGTYYFRIKKPHNGRFDIYVCRKLDTMGSLRSRVRFFQYDEIVGYIRFSYQISTIKCFFLIMKSGYFVTNHDQFALLLDE